MFQHGFVENAAVAFGVMVTLVMLKPTGAQLSTHMDGLQCITAWENDRCFHTINDEDVYP